MIKKILLTTAAAMLTFGSASALAKEAQPGTISTLKNIEKIMSHNISRAENAYYHGNNTARDFVGSATGDYMKYAIMDSDYTLYFEFDNAAPVARALQGKKILLNPIFDNGDTHISGWTCQTSADDMVTYQDDVGIATGTKSFLADLADHLSHVSSCEYLVDTGTNYDLIAGSGNGGPLQAGK